MSTTLSLNLDQLRKQPTTTQALLLLGSLLLGAGAWKAAVIGYTFVKFILSTFILPGKPLSSFGPKGSWAVITGASDGIGKQYAYQIASKGFNLILASRTQSKLDALAQEIPSKYPGIKVETIAVDFSALSEQDFGKLNSTCENKRIAILINNVGQSHSIPVPFAETDLKELTNIININCTATLRVTQIVLPHMISHKNGLIMTMGSFGGLIPTPLLATYSGSKAFLQYWSNCLASELRPSGITVHFIQAWLVTSAMSKIRRTSWQIPSEKQFVQAALSKIGRQCGSLGYAYSGSPYWSHALAAFYLLMRYGTMDSSVLEWNREQHVKIRQRALKKAARNAEQAKKET